MLARFFRPIQVVLVLFVSLMHSHAWAGSLVGQGGEDPGDHAPGFQTALEDFIAISVGSESRPDTEEFKIVDDMGNPGCSDFSHHDEIAKGCKGNPSTVWVHFLHIYKKEIPDSSVPAGKCKIYYHFWATYFDTGKRCYPETTAEVVKE